MHSEFKNRNKFVSIYQLNGEFAVSLNKRFVFKKFYYPKNINSNYYHTSSLQYHDKYRAPLDMESILIQKNEGIKYAFPPDYYQQLVNFNIRQLYDSNTDKMLANCVVNQEMIEDCLDIYCEELFETNNSGDIVQMPKQTFMLPVVTVQLIPLKNVNIVNKIVNKQIPSFTKKLLILINDKGFINYEPIHSSQKKIAEENRAKLNSATANYYNAMKSLTGQVIKERSLTPLQRTQLQKFKNERMEAQKNYVKCLNKKKIQKMNNIVKLNCGKKSLNRKLWEEEMSHFRSNNKVKKSGTGNCDFEEYKQLFDYFTNFSSRLLTKFPTQFFKPKTPISPVSKFGSPFIRNVKELHYDRFLQFYNNHISNTILEQSCIFISNLCKSLFNESTKTYNGQYFKYENFGYNNLFVLIRGGKRIFSTNKSRLFKICMPIDAIDLKYFGYLENNSYQIMKIDSVNYVLTPWMQLSQDVLFDGMTILHRVAMNLFSSYSRIDNTLTHKIPSLLLLPVILAFHNRRKTESFMHNCRYLIVNPLGEYSNLPGIITSFANINYTYLEKWLRATIAYKYKNFALTIMQVRNLKNVSINHLLSIYPVNDLWFNEKILNTDMLTVFIYSTYMMTKSPVDGGLEQVNNLWEILDDVVEFNDVHSDVEKLKDISLRMNVLEFTPNSYSDDYCYDPVFCQYVGYYISKYLKSKIELGELETKWNKCRNQDISDFANSNGLRGWTENNFFGRKGYDIIYEKIMSKIKGKNLYNNIVDYLEMDLITAGKVIEANKITVDDVADFHKDLIFHVVHKIQRGGSREIFCMDLNTKSQQNPLEKFFKHMCKLMPNEFISIPSNKRQMMLHSDFFEKTNDSWIKETMIWVLDCRRWAPHSVFQKYVHFIHGLSSILPSEFVVFFNTFAEKMMDKHFITREYVLKKMENNVKFNKYRHLLEKTNFDAVIIKVKFSFVMGIFNYLSSFLHASVQFLMKSLINDIAVKNKLGLVLLDPKCHSDDVIIKSYHQKEESIKISALLYDWFGKGANHMLSIKKSQINRNIYFEFLSILYLLDSFVPVVPKFSSTLPFKPSDKGYSSDITFAITQSIEMMTFGGNFEEAYIMMKITANFVRGCYGFDYVDLPYNLLGEIDSHPIELLLSGGLADIFRFLHFDDERSKTMLKVLSKNKIIDLEKLDFGLKWDMRAKIANFRQTATLDFQDTYDRLYKIAPWTLDNHQFGNGYLNILWYIHKLQDNSFQSSLVDEPVSRRYARIFGSSNYRNIYMDNVLIPVNKIYAIAKFFDEEQGEINIEEIDVSFEIQDIDKFEHFLSFIEFMCKDLSMLYESLAQAKLIDLENNSKSEKPVTFFQSEPYLSNLKINAKEFVTYVKEPNAFKLLGKRLNPVNDVKRLTQHIESFRLDIEKLSSDNLYQITQKLIKNESKIFYLIATTSTNLRIMDSFNSYIELIRSNSIKNKQFIVADSNAKFVDWNKKFQKGAVPNIVKDYVMTNWVLNFLIEKDVLYEVPLKINLQEKLKDLESKLTNEWKTVIYNSFPAENFRLIDYNYWYVWEKEQVKIGNSWYGKGILILKLPEAIFKLYIDENEISDIYIETDIIGNFSLASTWFLNLFFNMNSINLEIDSNIDDEDNLTFGYSNSTNLYQINYKRYNDTSFKNVSLDSGFLPEKYYLLGKLVRKNKNFFTEIDNQLTRVNFFLPEISTELMSLSNFIDLETLKQLNTPKINKFKEDLLLKEMVMLKLNRNELINKLPSTLFYKIIFNTSKRNNFLYGNYSDDIHLVETLFEWKKFHPDFSMPNLDEAKYMLSKSNVLSFPLAFLKFFEKNNIFYDEAFDLNEIVEKFSYMDKESFDNYIVSKYNSFNYDDQSKILAIISRTDYIYDKCLYIGDKAGVIVNELIMFFVQMLDRELLVSNILRSYVYKLNHLKKTNTTMVFQMLCARIVLDSILTFNNSCVWYKNFKLFYKILEEFWEQNLTKKLNTNTDQFVYLKTINFEVSKETFFKFVIDLFDNLYLYRNFGTNKIKGKFNLNIIINNTDLFTYFGNLKGLITKMSIYDNINTLKFSIDGERWQLNLTKGSPGLFIVKFGILEEELQEDFNDSYFYDETIYEDMTEFIETEIDEFAFVKIEVADNITITSKRNAAANVFYLCKGINPEIFESPQIVKVYNSDKNYASFNNIFLYEQFYIVYVGIKDFTGELFGYNLINKSDISYYFEEPKPILIEIDGEKMTKDIAMDKKLFKQMSKMDNYFQKIKESNEEIDLRIQKLEEQFNFDTNWEHEAMILRKKLIDFKEKIKKEEITEEEEKEEKTDIEISKQGNQMKNILRGFDLNQIDKIIKSNEEILSKLSVLGVEPKDNKSTAKQNLDLYTHLKTRRFEEEFKFVTDSKFLSELETLFPGFWENYNSGKIYITKKQKMFRLKTLQSLIDVENNTMVRKNLNQRKYVLKYLFSCLEDSETTSLQGDIFARQVEEFIMDDFELPNEITTFTSDILPENEEIDYQYVFRY